MNEDPLGFLITWSTYGTWLPGDARGWVEYKRGWKLPNPARELEARAVMTEDVCRLNESQRKAVEIQIAETCQHRKWYLHAVNCRSNHIHVVVTALVTAPKKIRSTLKTWATICLKENFDKTRKNWWTERGSIRFLNSEASLEAVIIYVLDGQDRKDREG
jgi:REP element-mobilizing transposase RayT